MNKTRCCPGRLCASIRLKYKNKFIILKVLFQPIMKFAPKYFGTDSMPQMAIKRPRAVHTGDCYQRESSRVIFRARSKTADTLLTHTTINTPHNQVSDFSTLRLRLLIAYRPTSHRHAARKQASKQGTNLHTLTSWHSSGGKRETVSFLIYRLLFI